MSLAVVAISYDEVFSENQLYGDGFVVKPLTTQSVLQLLT